MYFEVSGVTVSPLIPFLVAFFVSMLVASAGVSGAFLLLPFQVSVLGFTSPAVSPTNLFSNIVAIPSGVYRYMREKRMVGNYYRNPAGHIYWGCYPNSLFAGSEKFQIFCGVRASVHRSETGLFNDQKK
jgi:hypothetical protein